MSQPSLIQKLGPHLAAVVIFFLLAFGYASPVLDNKTIAQGDIVQGKAAAYEVWDFKQRTGEVTLWNGSLFSGMPAYVMAGKNRNNIFHHVYNSRVYLPKPANFLLMYLLAYYLMFVIIGVNPWVSILGAIGFTFATYNVAIIEAGHNYKISALVYAALMIGGTIRAYRGDYALGGVVFLFGFGVHLASYHYQITYYIAMLLGMYVLFELVTAIRSGEMSRFSKATGILAVASLLVLGTSTSKIWTTLEYTSESIRGNSELSSRPSSGLDKTYAFDWSHGIDETFSVMIPGMMGGSSQEELGKDSALYQDLRKKGARLKAPFSAPLYWGDMPGTGAPFYFGAIMCFLFVLGLFLVKGPMKWWLVVSTLLFIMLSWGKHFPFLSDLFFNYAPLYNKFRAVNTLMIIAQISGTILGVLALDNIIKAKVSNAEVKRAIMIAAGSCLAICGVLWIMGPSFFDFSGAIDARLEQAGYSLDALMDDRISLLQSDSLRSFIFILLAAAALWVYNMGKIKWMVLLPVLTVLVTVDIWQVDKRYLNDADFVSKRVLTKSQSQTQADKDILGDPDIHYRVMDQTVSSFSDAKSARYHKLVGGYHAAKMGRYRDLIETHLTQNNQGVFNMLNTKYFIQPQADGTPKALGNRAAFGNAWFVSEIKWVPNADAELAALDDVGLRSTAVIDERFESSISAPDILGAGTIELTNYLPNHMTYSCDAIGDGIVVFSEIYYEKGWQAYLNGEKVDHFRTNYVLRGMQVPAGKHKIEFKFFPASYYTGEAISLGFSVLSLLFIFGFGFLHFKGSRKNLLSDTSDSELSESI